MKNLDNRIWEMQHPKVKISKKNSGELFEFINLLDNAINNCCNPQDAYKEARELFNSVEFID